MSTAAFAADPIPVVATPVVVVPVTPPPPTLAGYVDAHFGFNKGQEIEEEDEGDGFFGWRSRILGGAGRASWSISPSFALQLDSWFNFVRRDTFFDEDQEEPTDTFFFGYGGVGTHMVFTTGGGLQAGALVSVGRSYGTWVNLAGEVAQSFGNFRVSAQAGLTLGVAGEPREDGERSWYVATNATFYPNPNLALTGYFQWGRWYETLDPDPQFEQGWDLGGRAEFKLGASPLSIYAGYTMSRWHGDYFLPPSEPWVGRSHTIYAGIRLLLGRDTLQELDNAVPFADYNLMYGDPFAHR